ncbi:alpha/beta hydrolase [Gorillibacterium timonense]|uniref:alpha/beta hydrolase n=1 Tax=Gorillibacterium timonense TaxID=1689269 RepID=UPI00071D4777|nr:alpha/beta hydrolase-fold protein [Gorillibacterium timonense]
MTNPVPYSYAVHLPDAYDKSKSYPVIFVLHGKGSNEQDLLQLVSPLAEEFILIGIRGDLPLGPGYQYYELKSLGNPIREQFDRAIRNLEAFIEFADMEYAIDSSRRYVLGFSQGAILALTLAHALGDKLKGIVALNGYVPDFVKTEYPLGSGTDKVAAFVSHGQYDQVFPAIIGEQTAAYMRTLTERTTFHLYPGGHEVTAANQRDLLQWLLQDSGLSEK